MIKVAFYLVLCVCFSGHGQRLVVLAKTIRDSSDNITDIDIDMDSTMTYGGVRAAL
ncbi:hypothetical protein PF008_g5933 [Phytophthora fragariae]|uniref:RxLR effector protein n=1 Tax=Phytophthora fragariae TaxID=53985 RepID=A0A6G0S760_9STRA|nr:hypothetical protein PF008_g5933 [Phytophthora fragariae]